MGKFDAVKNIFRSKKDEQADEQFKDKQAKAIAEGINRTCSEFLNILESDEVTTFPSKQNEVEKFVKCVMYNYCKDAAIKLRDESKRIVEELKNSHFRELKGSDQAILAEGQCGLSGIPKPPKGGSKEVKQVGLPEKGKKFDVAFINLPQQTMRVGLLFRSMKEIVEKVKDTAKLEEKNSPYTNIVAEFRGALNKGMTDSLTGQIKEDQEKAVKMLNEVCSKADDLAAEINVGEISKGFTSTISEMAYFKEYYWTKSTAKKKKKRKELESQKDDVEKFIKNLKNIENKLEPNGKYYQKLTKEEKTDANRILYWITGELKKYSWDSKKTYFENVYKFLAWAESICSELIIDNSADEEIKKWYDDMKDAYNVVYDTVKGKKVEK
ncbi:MAG: hypothetical protein Q4B93_04705 [Clostridia bacterium]|nr:hypothetical protein [Clostridia bacterium]